MGCRACHSATLADLDGRQFSRAPEPRGHPAPIKGIIA